MSSTQATVGEVGKGSIGTTDAFKQWHDMRDVYMKSWAKVMGEAVNSDDYAKANGTILESFLTVSAPFRDAQQKAMLGALEQLNMPSRADFVSLAERLANMEMLLDDIYAKLSQIQTLATNVAPRTTQEAKPEAESQQSASASSTRPMAEANAEAKSQDRKTPAKTNKNRAR
jgi:hypothetical protein